MKNIKTILLTTLVITGFFSVTFFTACTNVNCNNVICQNGGSCKNGVCNCPTGYSGTNCETAAKTVITYTNNTYTTISIAINGINGTIEPGKSLAFTGVLGSTALGSATTSGSASELGVNISGGILGQLITWNIADTFPSTLNDTLKLPLDIGSTYFFLRMTNKSSADIIDYYVNYEFAYGQYYGDVTVPKTGITYDLGYYLAYPGSNVETQSSALKSTAFPLTLPFTKNQIASVTVQ